MNVEAWSSHSVSVVPAKVTLAASDLEHGVIGDRRQGIARLLLHHCRVGNFHVAVAIVAKSEVRQHVAADQWMCAVCAPFTTVSVPLVFAALPDV